MVHWYWPRHGDHDLSCNCSMLSYKLIKLKRYKKKIKSYFQIKCPIFDAAKMSSTASWFDTSIDGIVGANQRPFWKQAIGLVIPSMQNNMICNAAFSHSNAQGWIAVWKELCKDITIILYAHLSNEANYKLARWLGSMAGQEGVLCPSCPSTHHYSYPPLISK